MSYQDVRHWYEDPPDEQDFKDAEIRAIKQALKAETGIDVDALQEFVDFTGELKDRKIVQDYPGDPDEELAAEEWRNMLIRLRTQIREHTPSSGQRDRVQPGGTPPGPTPTVEGPTPEDAIGEEEALMDLKPIITEMSTICRGRKLGFRLEYDVDYGIDRLAGWSVTVNGSVVVQFAPSPEEALVVAIQRIKDRGHGPERTLSEVKEILDANPCHHRARGGEPDPDCVLCDIQRALGTSHIA